MRLYIVIHVLYFLNVAFDGNELSRLGGSIVHVLLCRPSNCQPIQWSGTSFVAKKPTIHHNPVKTFMRLDWIYIRFKELSITCLST
jgi:hypothetical protein